MPPKLTAFKNGDEVRLLRGTPSQRRELWIVEDPRLIRQDWGLTRIAIVRQRDRNCSIDAPREWIRHSTVLDLLVANLDESGATAHA
jgi:hypothetical protein